MLMINVCNQTLNIKMKQKPDLKKKTVGCLLVLLYLSFSCLFEGPLKE